MKVATIILLAMTIALQANAQTFYEMPDGKIIADNIHKVFQVGAYVPGVKYPCDGIQIDSIIYAEHQGNPTEKLGARILVEVIYTDLSTGLSYRETWRYWSKQTTDSRGWIMSAEE